MAGTSQQFSTIEDVVDKINAAHPDFIILGGDVTDEKSTLEDMRRGFDVLARLEAPTYFVYGNHDRQGAGQLVGGRTHTNEQLEVAIAGAGIQMLVDEYTRASHDLALLGREDLSEPGACKGASSLAGENPDPRRFRSRQTTSPMRGRPTSCRSRWICRSLATPMQASFSPWARSLVFLKCSYAVTTRSEAPRSS